MPRPSRLWFLRRAGFNNSVPLALNLLLRVHVGGTSGTGSPVLSPGGDNVGVHALARSDLSREFSPFPVDFSNALGNADKRLPGEVIAHAALESYDSAKPGVSVTAAHDYAKTFFGFEYGKFTPNFARTVTKLGLTWRSTRLNVLFRTQMQLVTPIPMNTYLKLRAHEKLGNLPRDITSVEIVPQPK